jgi:DNA-binding GntR family transcriptional regulator
MTITETPLPPSVFEGLDRVGPMPLYHQIAERIERAIVDGALPVESWIEDELTLATRLGTSRGTTRRALEQLVSRGLLQRRQGRGTQVISGRVTRTVALTSLYDDLGALGRRPGTILLRNESTVADAEAALLLGIEPGAETIELERVRSSNGEPLAVLTNLLPRREFPLHDGDLESHGLYQLLRARGVLMRAAQQSIGAREASPRECSLLELPAGSTVLTMTRTVTDPGGRVVDVGRHCYRPDRYRFEISLTGV